MEALQTAANASAEHAAAANLTLGAPAAWGNGTAAGVAQDLEDMLAGVCHGTTSADGGSFAALAGLHRMAPHYFLALSALIKPAISTFVFGPPRPRPLEVSLAGKAKRFVKQGLQFCYLCLAASQTMSDVFSAWRAIKSDGQALQRVLSVAVILATSTNVQASFNAWALWYATKASLAWAQSHSYLVELGLWEFLGPMGWLYLNAMMWTYLPLSLGLLALAAPVLLAYIWISLPMFILTLLTGYVVSRTCNIVLPWYRGEPTHDALVSATSLEEVKVHLTAVDEYSEAAAKLFREDQLAETIREVYRLNMEMYRQTGMPARAWLQYWGRTLVLPPFLHYFVPVAARVYRGDWARAGYLGPLWVTLTERSLSAYLSCVGSALMGKLLFVWLWL